MLKAANEYQGPKWAMEILDEHDLAARQEGELEDQFYLYRRRCDRLEEIPKMGWFTSEQMEAFLVGYEMGFADASTECRRYE